MRRTITINLYKDTLEATKQRDLLINAIKRNVIEEEEQLQHFLQYFCNNIREEYMMSSLCVDYIDLHQDKYSGDISVSFVGYAYLGCRDLDGRYEHEETLEYKIDTKNSSIIIEGDFPEERDPDEI